MSPGGGTKPGRDADKSLGDVVSEVSQKASQLVREEIELAKAEVRQKVSSLGKGVAIGVAAGVFLIFGITMLFHMTAWLISELLDTDVWVGYGIVTLALFLLGALAGFLAFRAIKKGSPPTPDLAIQEVKRTRAEIEHQKIQRDQVHRALERGEEVKS